MKLNNPGQLLSSVATWWDFKQTEKTLQILSCCFLFSEILTLWPSHILPAYKKKMLYKPCSKLELPTYLWCLLVCCLGPKASWRSCIDSTQRWAPSHCTSSSRLKTRAFTQPVGLLRLLWGWNHVCGVKQMPPRDLLNITIYWIPFIFIDTTSTKRKVPCSWTKQEIKAEIENSRILNPLSSWAKAPDTATDQPADLSLYSWWKPHVF